MMLFCGDITSGRHHQCQKHANANLQPLCNSIHPISSLEMSFGFFFFIVCVYSYVPPCTGTNDVESDISDKKNVK